MCNSGCLPGKSFSEKDQIDLSDYHRTAAMAVEIDEAALAVAAAAYKTNVSTYHLLVNVEPELWQTQKRKYNFN